MRIVDRETREVIRQIPPEYALRLADDLKATRWLSEENILRKLRDPPISKPEGRE